MNEKPKLSFLSIFFSLLILSITLQYQLIKHYQVDQIEQRLHNYSNLIKNELDEISIETNEIFSRLSATEFYVCDEAYQKSMREIQFDHYLAQNVARLLDNNLTCTSMAGVITDPLNSISPDLTYFGVKVWFNQPNQIVDHERTYVVLEKDGFRLNIHLQTLFSLGAFSKSLPTFTAELILGDNVVLTTHPDSNTTKIGDEKIWIKYQSISTILPIKVVSGVNVEYIRDKVNDVFKSTLPVTVIVSFLLTLLLNDIYFRSKFAKSNQLLRSLKNNKFNFVIHPIYDSKSMKYQGGELELTWDNSNMKLQLFQDFLPYLQHKKVANQVLRHTLEKSSSLIREILKSGKFLVIKIPYQPSESKKIISTLEQIFKVKCIPLNQIFLTFNATRIYDLDASFDGIREAKKIGFSIGVSSFGLRHANSDFLKKASVDMITLDKYLTDISNRSIITNDFISNLSLLVQKHSSKIIAPQIELEIQMQTWTKANVQLFQGNHFKKAVPLTDWSSIFDING
ncbi:EAL domain-containing protein [Vibrio mimicus]